MMYCFYTKCQLEKETFQQFDFDVIHNVVNEYFRYHVPQKCGFTHHRGSLNGKNMEAHFYLYYDTNDSVNPHYEMKKINEILSNWGTTCAWNPTNFFKVREAEPWSNHALCLEYVFRSVNF